MQKRPIYFCKQRTPSERFQINWAFGKREVLNKISSISGMATLVFLDICVDICCFQKRKSYCCPVVYEFYMQKPFQCKISVQTARRQLCLRVFRVQISLVFMAFYLAGFIIQWHKLFEKLVELQKMVSRCKNF